MRGPPHLTVLGLLRIGRLGFGTGRHRASPERGTTPTIRGRTCSPRRELQSCERDWAGLAKRLGELISHPNPSLRFASNKSLYTTAWAVCVCVGGGRDTARIPRARYPRRCGSSRSTSRATTSTSRTRLSGVSLCRSVALMSATPARGEVHCEEPRWSLNVQLVKTGRQLFDATRNVKRSVTQRALSVSPSELVESNV